MELEGRRASGEKKLVVRGGKLVLEIRILRSEFMLDVVIEWGFESYLFQSRDQPREKSWPLFTGACQYLRKGRAYSNNSLVHRIAL